MPADERLTAQDFITDMRIAGLLAGHVRRQAVTRVFGLSADDQSFLVSVAVIGGAASVLGGLATRPLPRLSGADLFMGGALVNTGIGAVAGPAVAAVPLAGAIIGGALLVHAARPSLARSMRAAARAEHFARTSFRSFLGEMSGSASR